MGFIVDNRHIVLPNGFDVLYPCGDPCRQNVLEVFGRQLLVACFVLEDDADAVPEHALTTTIGDLEDHNKRTAAGDLYLHSRDSLRVLVQGPEEMHQLAQVQREFELAA